MLREQLSLLVEEEGSQLSPPSAQTPSAVGKGLGPSTGESLKKKPGCWTRVRLFYSHKGSSDMLLVWLSFSQASPRESVQHCLCWAWRTAKGGKEIFILDKNDPEITQSACPNPPFFSGGGCGVLS